MIKSIHLLFDKKMFLLLIVMLLISPVLCGQNTYTICLVQSHYLTIYLNNVYLLALYQYTYSLNRLSPYLITRIGEKRFYTHSYISILLISCFYTLTIYISYYFFFGAIPQDTLVMTILFMIFNILMIEIESTIVYLQIGQKKNFIYLALPILMNLIFHITFTNLI